MRKKIHCIYLKKFHKTWKAKYWILFRVTSAPSLLNHLKISELDQVVPLISLCDKNQNLKLNAAAK